MPIRLSNYRPSDSSNVTVSFQAMVNDAVARGRAVELEPVTYHIGKVIVPPGLTINGNGATLRMIDSQVDGTRLLSTATGETGRDPIRISDITFDMNRLGQGTYLGGELEHHAGIFADADDQEDRLRVYVTNCEFIDSAGDGIDCFRNVHLIARGVKARDIFRSGILNNGGNCIMDIDGYHGSGATHIAQLESEVFPGAEGYGNNRRSHWFINNACVEVSSGGNAQPNQMEAFDGGSVTITNSYFENGLSYVAGHNNAALGVHAETFLKVENSTLFQGQSSSIRNPQNAKISNSTIIGVNETGSAFTDPAVLSVTPFYLNSTDVTHSDVEFIACNFKHLSAESGELWRGISVASVEDFSHVCRVIDCVFDESLEFGIEQQGGGVFHVDGGDFQPTKCFYWSSNATYESEIHVGRISLGSSTTYGRLDIESGSSITHDGTLIDSSSNVFDAGSTVAGDIKGFRTIIGATATGPSLVRDEFVAIGPSVGNPRKWIAINSHATAGTWVQVDL